MAILIDRLAVPGATRRKGKELISRVRAGRCELCGNGPRCTCTTSALSPTSPNRDDHSQRGPSSWRNGDARPSWSADPATTGHPRTPSIIMSPDHCPWTQISSLVPFGDARACGKIGARSLAEVDPAWRSEPEDQFDPGSRWWGCALLLRARGSDFFHPCSVPAGDRLVVIGCAGRISRMEEVEDAELVVDRVAALDLGKTGLEACLRVPSPNRARQADAGAARLRAPPRPQLLEMVGVVAERWAVQAGGDGIHQPPTGRGCTTCWRPTGLDCWLVNAREVKNVPGRAQDRSGRRGVAGQGGRAGHVPALAGAPARDPPAA